MHTVGSIAKEIGGRVVGNSDQEISSISPLEDVKSRSVVFLKNRKYLNRLEKNIKPLCLIVDFEPEEEMDFDYIVIDTQSKDSTFIKTLSLFEEKEAPAGTISEMASVDPEASIGKNVTISDFVTIGKNTAIQDDTCIGPGTCIGRNCTIGKGCRIYPNVTIYPDTVLDDNVIVHAGAVIGCDGFGYSKIEGKYEKIPQIGGVHIAKNVEIGANSTIDRATLGCTEIGENTKIDNLVMIAHNVEIGISSIICANSGIAGSVKIGNNVILAGFVGVADHIVIEDDVLIGAKSGIMKKLVKKGSYMFGYPAIDYKEYMTFAAMRPKVKGMYKDLKKIKEKLELG
ncbi:MAG: UDP-3-O-(3-hydroxymyristoyl)glucosamine N-acyltransferase [Spirochaetes bacterium]|nr:UDP-3-O-(3-hydroxymyristoyl)glucosamine N-acyltransferase [Spirochaetota bacterium]